MTFVLSTLQLVKGDYIEFYIGSSDASYSVVGFTGTNDSQSFFEVSQILGNQTIGMDEAVACSYTTDAAQSMANLAETTILFEDKVFDTHGAYNTATGVYTVPVAGLYSFSMIGTYGASNTWAIGESAAGIITINGTTKAYNDLVMIASSASSVTVTFTVIFSATLAQGALIIFKGYQSSGGALTLLASGNGNSMSIQRIK